MTPSIHGYAIVSADDRIADAHRRMPDVLRNEADWRYYQDELDRADLVVLGRIAHENHPNPGRRRLVVSSGVEGIVERADGVWWNPAAAPWADVVRAVSEGRDPALPGLRIAITGGRDVFDLFAGIGYDAFHLARASRVTLPGGVALFAACDTPGTTADATLNRLGLVPDDTIALDPAAGVDLVIWRRRM